MYRLKLQRRCHVHTCIEHIITGQGELYNNKKGMSKI
jgi:hypothetical protein